MNATIIPQKVTLARVLANAQCCTILPQSSIEQLRAEHAALVAVAEAARHIDGSLGWTTVAHADSKNGIYAKVGALRDALRNLAAVRSGKAVAS